MKINILFWKRLLQISFLVIILVSIIKTAFFRQTSPQSNNRKSAKLSPLYDQRVSRGVVAQVLDGDTIVLDTGETIRYQEIDTPEIAHFPKRAECFGERAKEINSRLVLGKVVTLVSGQANVDRYDRFLRYIYVGDEFINEKLVSEGAAFVLVYPPDDKYVKKLKISEDIARKYKRGVWGECDLSKRGRAF